MKNLTTLLAASLLGIAGYQPLQATSVTLHSAFADGGFSGFYVNFDDLPSDVTDIVFVTDNIPWPSESFARKVGAPHHLSGVLVGTRYDGNSLPATLSDWDDHIVQVFYSPSNFQRPFAETGLHDWDIDVISTSLGTEHFEGQYSIGIHSPDGGTTAALMGAGFLGLTWFRRHLKGR